MVRSQTEMLLNYCSAHFAAKPELIKSEATINIEEEIEKHQPSNYQVNLSVKLVRIWDQLVLPLKDRNGGQ